MTKLTQQRLKETFHYDPLTGVFTALTATGRRKVGASNLPRPDGYIIYGIGYRRYLAHVLAWLYMTGELPSHQVDHENTIRSDNRWANLRRATRSLNSQNQRKAHKNSKTGLLGVRKYHRKFISVISLAGTKRHLGSFDTAELAYAAYVTAKRQLHEGCTL